MNGEVHDCCSTNVTHMEMKKSGEAAAITRTEALKKVVDRRCEVGLMECGTHGTCVPLGDHRRDGQCQCDAGYEWEAVRGGCVENTSLPTPPGESQSTPSPPSTPARNTSSAPPTPLPVPSTTTGV